MSDENNKPPTERRAAPRVETPLFEGMLGDRSGEIRCRISNLSRLGACAVSNVALPEMSRVKVRFMMEEPESEGRAISCEGAVVRCQKRSDGQFEIGLFFTTLSVEDRAAIERLAARGAPLSVRPS
jgi:PilZ domain